MVVDASSGKELLLGAITFAGVVLIAVSLLVGETYIFYWDVVRRTDDPRRFWKVLGIHMATLLLLITIIWLS